LLAQKSENGDGESLIYGVSSMQGWRISMEDAHATVLDFAGEEGKPTGNDKRLAFFGVYDGHGGDKVALYAGEQLHQIVAKQEAFKQGDISRCPVKRQDLRRMSIPHNNTWQTLTEIGQRR
jgi:protein phosphatase 2C family protein 2/3